MRRILDNGSKPGYAPILYEIFDRGTWVRYRTALEVIEMEVPSAGLGFGGEEEAVTVEVVRAYAPASGIRQVLCSSAA